MGTPLIFTSCIIFITKLYHFVALLSFIILGRLRFLLYQKSLFLFVGKSCALFTFFYLASYHVFMENHVAGSAVAEKTEKSCGICCRWKKLKHRLLLLKNVGIMHTKLFFLQWVISLSAGNLNSKTPSWSCFWKQKSFFHHFLFIIHLLIIFFFSSIFITISNTTLQLPYLWLFFLYEGNSTTKKKKEKKMGARALFQRGNHEKKTLHVLHNSRVYAYNFHIPDKLK